MCVCMSVQMCVCVVCVLWYMYFVCVLCFVKLYWCIYGTSTLHVFVVHVCVCCT